MTPNAYIFTLKSPLRVPCQVISGVFSRTGIWYLVKLEDGTCHVASETLILFEYPSNAIAYNPETGEYTWPLVDTFLVDTVIQYKKFANIHTVNDYHVYASVEDGRKIAEAMTNGPAYITLDEEDNINRISGDYK